MPGDAEEYVERVLACVESVPRGRATTYGAVARHLGGSGWTFGPRRVGNVMSQHGAAVPWWRCVRVDGSLDERIRDEARAHYLEEGTPLRPSGAVDLERAEWPWGGDSVP